MKKNILFLFLSLPILFSCNNDDDSSSSQTELSGTHWIKTTDSNRHFTFTSATEYEYYENGSTHPGTYIFNGSNGTMTETSSNFELEFQVNGSILSANQNTSDPDFEALYDKQ